MTPVRRPAALLGLLLLTSACAADPPTGRQTSGPPSAAGTEVQVSAVGDSITEADSDDFDGGDIGPGSWANYAQGDGVRVIGGWAHAGATTEDMLAGVLADVTSGAIRPGPAVLVLMGGSNDIDAGVPIPTILHNLSEIPRAVGAEQVTLSAVPPEAPVQDAVDALNARAAGVGCPGGLAVRGSVGRRPRP